MQYSTKGKTSLNGSSNTSSSNNTTGTNNDSTSTTSAEIKALELSIASMQSSIASASSVSSKMNQLTNKVEILEAQKINVVSEKDANTKNTVYGTGYINELEERVNINRATNLDSTDESELLTIGCLKQITNVRKIPYVTNLYHEEANSNTVYNTEYINDVLQRIPTPIDDSGVNNDSNPMMYTADYINEHMPEVFETEDTSGGPTNVYSTHYINELINGLIRRINDLESQINK